jgi:hypothetical protein
MQKWTISGTGNANQQWLFTSAGGGWYTVTNRNSGKVLDLGDLSLADAGAIQQWTGGSGSTKPAMAAHPDQLIDLYGSRVRGRGTRTQPGNRQWPAASGRMSRGRCEAPAGTGPATSVSRGAGAVDEVFLGGTDRSLCEVRPAPVLGSK